LNDELKANQQTNNRKQIFVLQCDEFDGFTVEDLVNTPERERKTGRKNERWGRIE
jgi:hypothetical protein